MSRRTSSARPARSAWANAECSESTATSCPGAAAEVTSRPPMTSDSLLASARVVPRASVAIVGRRPAAPVIAFSTTPQSIAASSVEASGPTRSSGQSVPSSSRSASAAELVGTATISGENSPICWASSSILLPAADRALMTNLSRFRETTSRVWVPMDPVEPRRTTVRTPINASAVPLQAWPVLSGWRR